MTVSTTVLTRPTTDSTDRAAVLPVARPSLSHLRQHGERASGFARKLLSALMRSLAAPHI